MLDIKAWLETTEIKTAETSFIKPPPLPYIVFTENKDVRGADNRNCISERTISIEFYSSVVDHTSEGEIEGLLNEKLIEYSKDRIWIDTENMFETIYDFNLIEKF